MLVEELNNRKERKQWLSVPLVLAGNQSASTTAGRRIDTVRVLAEEAPPNMPDEKPQPTDRDSEVPAARTVPA